jgi:hypothetical protein
MPKALGYNVVNLRKNKKSWLLLIDPLEKRFTANTGKDGVTVRDIKNSGRVKDFTGRAEYKSSSVLCIRITSNGLDTDHALADEDPPTTGTLEITLEPGGPPVEDVEVVYNDDSDT